MTTAFRAIFGDSLELSAIEHPEADYLARAGLRERLAQQKVELRTADIVKDTLPFDGGFDAVLFCGVIEHLAPTDVLVGARTPPWATRRHGPPHHLLDESRGVRPHRVTRFRNGAVMDPPLPQGYAHGHIRLYTRHDMQALLEHAGLRITDWRYVNWERIYIGRTTLRGRLLYAGQVMAPTLRRQLATSWVCSRCARVRADS